MQFTFEDITFTWEGKIPERVIYLLSESTDMREGYVYVTGMYWNRDLSPWPSEAVFRGGGDFAGGADAYLRRLEAAMAAFEEGKVTRRGIAGYSLAGLFCLYAGYESDLFEFVASASGSLWYEGFTDYMRSHTPRFQSAYLSLGDKEERTKNPRMGRVGECTRLAQEILKAQGIDAPLEWNPGGHFNEPDQRLLRAAAAWA